MLKGRQFYLLRKGKNMTRDQLGEILNITYNEVTIYENGIREIPDDLYQKWFETMK